MLNGELSGETGVKLDDMGRIGLPRQLRDAVGTSELVLLRGEQPCLWLYTVEEWRRRKEAAIRKSPSILVRRRWNAQQSVELDKQGRILIPPSLRKHARLAKDCIVVGQDDYIEIWAEDSYVAYFEATADDFISSCGEQGELLAREGDLGDGGNSAYSGAAGAGPGVPGPEGRV
ncbi:MAG: hypothetical protein FWD88_05925 [Treponema sp.]|nr:hypothetical protein [Treponema sp.]